MVNAAADPNLLFGLLALQMDFISRDQLIAAMKDWALDKQSPLGEVLVRQQVLTPERRALLDGLLNGQEQKQAPGGNDTHGDTPNPRDSVIDPLATRTQAHESIGGVTRYRPLRAHAKGGLGQVYVALDEELHREVALKEIQESHAASLESRARFVLEAQITGGLEHPGIVPVYGFGIYPDGRPYYAMRFIRGQTLKEACDAYHASPRAGPRDGERVLQLRQLLRRFLDICNAIEYAHSRGVLHRDLKPSNVMLGKFGETLVVDWGLAKAFNRPEAPSSLAQEPLLKPSASGSSAETLAGTALGTPAYMSPEQAAGRLDLLGPASDVYSLGATLYYLLTGRAAQEDRELPVLLQKVQRGEFPKPRQISSRVDKGLEAICLKAMALEPGARYASPSELAKDIDHWLADEPVKAWNEPLSVRCERWTRKHRKLVTGLGVLLVALLLYHVYAAQRESFLRHKADSAREETDFALGRAKRDETTAKTLLQTTRSLLYQAEMRRIFSFLEYAHLDRADQLLKNWMPKNDQPDLRQWEWYYLRERSQRGLSLASHRGEVTALAYAPDGTLLATAGSDGEIKIWQVINGDLTTTLTAHPGGATSLAWNVDGSLLASAGKDGISIWAMPKGTELLSMRDIGSVLGVAFSSKEKFAAAAADGKVILWESDGFAKGRAGDVKMAPNHAKGATAVAFSPDGNLLASAGLDSAVRLSDAASGIEKHVLKEHAGPVHSLTFNREGSVLVTGGGAGPETGELLFWDVKTSNLKLKRYGLSDRVVGLSFNPIDRLAVGTADGQLRLYSLARTSEAFAIRGDPVGLSTLSFSPNGRHIACGGRSGRIFLANPSGGQENEGLFAPTQRTALAFHPKSKLLASAGSDIQMWDLDRPDKPGILKIPGGEVSSLAFLLAGTNLAAATRDRDILLYDLQTPNKAPSTLKGHEGPVRVLAAAAAGDLLASAGADKQIRIWDAATGKTTKVLDGHSEEILALTFSPDGHWLASAGTEKIVRVFDLHSGEEFAMVGHDEAIEALAFHPASRRLVSGCRGGKIQVWNVEERVLIGQSETSSPILSLAFHPGGRRLASAAQNETVRIWDATSGQEVLELDYSGNQLRALAFSPDGRYLAAVGFGGCRIWDSGPVGK